MKLFQHRHQTKAKPPAKSHLRIVKPTESVRTDRVLFSMTLFLSAFLLFTLEPMVAKKLLPSWGGSSSVWITCMLFFQVMLLVGYFYSHIARLSFSRKTQSRLQFTYLAVSAIALPFTLMKAPAMDPSQTPVVGLLALLAVMIGAPFFSLSAISPIVQHWFGSRHPKENPYYLYSASNLGSLIALVTYPTLIEPTLGLRTQAVAWGVGFFGLTSLLFACAVRVRDWKEPAEKNVSATNENAPSLRMKLRWLLLAFVPSSLMLGVTTYFTTDIASIPLLWVLPLALYLLSFIIVFSSIPKRFVSYVREILPLLVPATIYLLLSEMEIPVGTTLFIHLCAFFVIAVSLHSKLAASRPNSSHLTGFYLWLSFGGMLGGLFNSILAPFLFSAPLEYPLMLGVACLLGFMKTRPRRARYTGERWLQAGAGLAFFAFVWFSIINEKPGDGVILRERNFFGVQRVINVDTTLRKLVNGTTIHGIQSLAPEFKWQPLTYYHPDGPIGDIFTAVGRGLMNRHWGGIGLGTGSLAAWGRSDQKLTFFEIDPKVVDAASKYFTYLADGQARQRILVGDARLRLQEIPDNTFTILFVDAFSSDAIPVHLLTKESLELFVRKTTAEGIIAIHITNRHLSLEPIVERLARELKLSALISHDSGDDKTVRYSSSWVVLAPKNANLKSLVTNEKWVPLQGKPKTPLWTDDFTSFLHVIDFSSTLKNR